MASKAVSKDAPSKSKAPSVSKTAAEMAPPMAYSPFMELRNRMDRLFDDVFYGSGFPMLARDRPTAGFGRDLDWPKDWPGGGTSLADVKFDIGEDEKAIEISAEMPGMDEDDVDLTLSDGLLTIKGEKKAEHEEKDKNFHLTERRYGAFQRSFRLPDTVDEDKVKARFEKGVLKVMLPKNATAKAKTKKISISKS